MVFISLTRLHLRSVRRLMPFLKTNEAIVKQLVQMPGFIGGAELIDKGFVFWTLTAFEGEAAMKAFRNGLPHKDAMRNISDWCDEASYAHWLQDSATLPGWTTAWKKLQENGHFTKLRTPSARQQSGGGFPPPKWTILSRPLRKA